MRDENGFLYPVTPGERVELNKLRLVEESLREDGGEAWRDAVRELNDYRAAILSRYTALE